MYDCECIGHYTTVLLWINWIIIGSYQKGKNILVLPDVHSAVNPFFTTLESLRNLTIINWLGLKKVGNEAGSSSPDKWVSNMEDDSVIPPAQIWTSSTTFSVANEVNCNKNTHLTLSDHHFILVWNEICYMSAREVRMANSQSVQPCNLLGQQWSIDSRPYFRMFHCWSFQSHHPQGAYTIQLIEEECYWFNHFITWIWVVH